MLTKQQKNGSFSYTTVHAQGIGSKGHAYVANVTFKSRVNPSGSRAEENVFRLTSKGSAPNQVVFSFDSNGYPTFKSVCKG